jgi:ABC-type uncharacterized transport system.
MKLPKFLSSKKFKMSTVSTLIIITFIIGVVLLNILVSALSSRFNIKSDFSTDKIGTVSSETINFIKTVKEPVSIIVLAPEESFKQFSMQYYADERLNDTIKNVAAINPNISVQYLDLQKEPLFLQEHGEDKLYGKIIMVKSAKRDLTISTTELFVRESGSDQVYVTGDSSEKVIATKINGVLTEKAPKVTFLVGHDEVAVSGLKNQLSENGYEILEQSIVTDEIDKNSDFIIIPAPQTDYSEAEIKKLDDFLNDNSKSRNLIYSAALKQPVLKNLEAFLNDWGIEVLEGTVYETDPSNYISGQPFLFAAKYESENEITDYAKEKNLPTILGAPRPLNISFEEKNGKTTSILLNSSESTFLTNVAQGEEFTVSEDDKPGPFPQIISSKKSTSEKIASNVIVVSCVEFFDASLLDQYGNGFVSISLFNKYAEITAPAQIAVRMRSAPVLRMTQSTVFLIGFIIFIILVPVAAVFSGFFIWLRRRRK